MSRNLLESLINWLETRSRFQVFKGREGNLMREYAAELRKELPTATEPPEVKLEDLFGKGDKHEPERS